jgi:hypothetical protein
VKAFFFGIDSREGFSNYFPRPDYQKLAVTSFPPLHEHPADRSWQALSLLYGRRISEGKPALGFLNPWLFHDHDIISGTNPGYNSDGFPAIDE